MPTITEIAAIINLCAVHSKNFMRDPVPEDRNQQTGGRSGADRGQAGAQWEQIRAGGFYDSVLR